jgi:hypothetical protein
MALISGRQHAEIENFLFRDLHPNVFMGTASDRYVGWIGQIYSEDHYANHITRRKKFVGGKGFVEEVLPVESVKEYFQHFRILELDFTFYRILLDKDQKPTQNFHVLRTYRQHLNKGDRLILKVPQIVFAKKLRKGTAYVENEQYLNPEVFTRQFYEPTLELLDPWIDGFVFEQEYQRKQDRSSAEEQAAELKKFFSSIPKDNRYHVEFRTETFLSRPVLMRYEDAYARAHPFNALVEGMMTPQMMDETTDIMRTAIEDGVQIKVIINNRAGGNAPLIAQKIAKQFLTESDIASSEDI